MNRRIIAPKIFYAVLVGAVIFLSLLPSLGWIWHRVLPEHQHIFVGTLREDLPVSPAFVASDCTDCIPGETVLHLPGLGAFQIAATAMSLMLTLCLPIPNEIISRLVPHTRNFSIPFLPRLDPPPKCA